MSTVLFVGPMWNVCLQDKTALCLLDKKALTTVGIHGIFILID